jgi:O-antigen/teichoic acid export membrane protein
LHDDAIKVLPFARRQLRFSQRSFAVVLEFMKKTADFAPTSSQPAVSEPKRPKRSSFLVDIALTLLTSVATGVSLLLVSRFLAQGLGPEGFGVYSIARRVFFAVAPCATLAMSVAMARYVAIADSAKEKSEVLLAGFLLSVVPCFVLCALCWPFRAAFGVLLFRSTGYEATVTSLLFLLMGNAFYVVLYSFYRGAGLMTHANFWQLLIVALGPIPLAAFLSSPGQPASVIAAMGALYALALVPLVGLGWTMWRTQSPVKWKTMARRLLRYGLARAAGGLILASIFASGPLLAPYLGSLKEAGYLAAGQSVLSLAESGLVAFGLVVLPRAAQMVAQGQHELLRHRIGDVFGLILHLGLFMSVQLMIHADVIITAWLGPSYHAALPIMRVILLAIMPYLVYVMLRSIVDAIEERGVNTWNLLWALIFTLSTSWALGRSALGMTGVALGTAIGFTVLGIGTWHYLWKNGWVKNFRCLWKECLVLNAVAALFSFGLHEFLSGLPWGAGQQLLLVAVVVGLLFLFYCLVLWRAGATWIEQIATRLVKPQEISTV